MTLKLTELRRPKFATSVMSALAAVAAFAVTVPAFAAAYTFSPVALMPGVTSVVGVTDLTSTTDTFTFTLDSLYTTALGDLAFEGIPAKNNVISSVDLSVYSGTPTGMHTLIGTTGVVSDPTPGQGFVFSSSLTEILTSGSYYLQVDSVVPANDIGQYVVSATVSSAPEPSTWALLIAGVAMVGGALRWRRRGSLVVA